MQFRRSELEVAPGAKDEVKEKTSHRTLKIHTGSVFSLKLVISKMCVLPVTLKMNFLQDANGLLFFFLKWQLCIIFNTFITY